MGASLRLRAADCREYSDREDHQPDSISRNHTDKMNRAVLHCPMRMQIVGGVGVSILHGELSCRKRRKRWRGSSRKKNTSEEWLMRITKHQLVAGYPSLKVRAFLRRYCVGLFVAPAARMCFSSECRKGSGATVPAGSPGAYRTA